MASRVLKTTSVIVVILVFLIMSGWMIWSMMKDNKSTTLTYRPPDNNLYWKYINRTVKQDMGKNSTHCIVCSLLPHTSLNPFVFSIDLGTWEKVNKTWTNNPLNIGNGTLSRQDPNAGFEFQVKQGMQFPVCFWRYLGNGTEQDREAATECEPKEEGGESCVRVNGSSKWQKGLLEKECNSTINLDSDSGGRPMHNTKTSIWIPDWYWYCGGNRLWFYLPKLQRGRCSLVELNAHLTLIFGEHTHRRTRSLDGSVPNEHRLVSEGTRFAEILFPMFGVGKLRQQLEKVHYRLATFVNETIQALDGVKQELTALRLMTTQNRMALDMILAKEGGVCVMIGKSCCTYVPPNDSGNISVALEKMHEIASQLRQDEEGNSSWGWNLWAMVTSLRGIILTCVPIILILLILLCCAPFLCQCLSSMITHSVQAQYQMLQQQPCDSEEDKEQICKALQQMFNETNF